MARNRSKTSTSSSLLGRTQQRATKMGSRKTATPRKNRYRKVVTPKVRAGAAISRG